VDDNMTLEYQTAEAVTHVEEAIRQKTEDLTSENKKLRAQLKYIKSQVAPHFVERIEAING
jgi:sensor histidine kinase YesM